VASNTCQLTESTRIEQLAAWRRSVPIVGVIRTADVDAADFRRAYRSRMVGQDAVDCQDVTCSFCGVTIARFASSLTTVVICQMCVAKCAKIFDHEVGIPGHPAGGQAGGH
jgi:hypothetical protein